MKKTYKKLFGFLGLVIVAVMTFFAATLPGPEALATSNVTESIVVRVLPGSPDVNINSPKSGSVFATPRQVLGFDYSGVNDLVVTMEKKMPYGTPQIYSIFAKNANLVPGSETIPVDFAEPQYGYGEYLLKISGQGTGNTQDDDSSSFEYYPIVAEVDDDNQTGKINALLEYDEADDDLSYFEINVYDDKGNLVQALSPIIVNKPTKVVELPFAENKIPAGTYTVAFSAFDNSNNLIYKSYDTVLIYKPINIPNTGSLLANLNISKTDYLITGLVIFALVGIFGIVFITKDKRNSK